MLPALESADPRIRLGMEWNTSLFHTKKSNTALFILLDITWSPKKEKNKIPITPCKLSVVKTFARMCTLAAWCKYKMRHRTSHKSTTFSCGKNSTTLFLHSEEFISRSKIEVEVKIVQIIGWTKVSGFGKVSIKARKFKIQQSSASFDQKLNWMVATELNFRGPDKNLESLWWFFVYFLAGLSVLVIPLLMVPILYFWEMSVFEPRALP